MRKSGLLLLAQLLFGVTLAQQAPYPKIDSLMSSSRYDEAQAEVLRATNGASEEVAYRLSNKLAEIQMLLGKLDDAESTLKTLISTPQNNDFLKAETKTNLGFLYLNKARNDMAQSSLQEALDLFQQSGKQNSLEAARCLATISSVYYSTGKLNQAEENGLIALQLRQKLSGDDSEEVAASYNDLGLVYGQSDSDKALDYYERALTVYEKLHGKEHRKIAIANNNIGIIDRQLKLYGEAVNSFETAESIWKKIYPNGHPNQAMALVNLGLTYGAMGNTKASLGYLERALAIYKTYYGDKHSDIASVLNQIGLIELQDGKVDEALQHFQQAIRANSPTFSRSDMESNPKVTEHYNGKVMLYSLRFKAQGLEARHFSKTLKFQDLTAALATLHSCDTLIDLIRFNSSDANDKLELGATANEVYEDGVRVAEAMSEMTLKSKSYQRIAFYFAEKSKSAVLQESIAEAEAKSFAGIPMDMLERENAIKASMALFAQKLSQKPDLEQERQLRERLFTANREYAAFIQNLEKDYPDYFNLKFNKASPSIEDIQKLLDKDKIVVSYFIAEKGQRLYSFVIRQKTFHVYNSTIPPEFEKVVKGFTNSIYYSVPDLYRETSGKLSSILLRGVPKTPEILIIPSGRLGTIPFEALAAGKIRPSATFENFPFLIKSHAISYEFSAGLLLQKKNLSASEAKPSIFLCAPISFPPKDNLVDLPGTEQEVNNISNLFTGSSQIAKGAEATEGLIKSGALAKFRYLHFATHGVVDETSPDLSRIYLQTTATEDGNMYSGEIFNLHLNADLAVLSACQTGLGKYSKGEGVIGLSRALVYAGARNIMVSYWSVADASTATLMTDFYTELLKQKEPNFGTALQVAKRNMIRSGKFVSPYYWAPFVLIGF